MWIVAKDMLYINCFLAMHSILVLMCHKANVYVEENHDFHSSEFSFRVFQSLTLWLRLTDKSAQKLCVIGIFWPINWPARFD